jgi:hypothetical protein
VTALDHNQGFGREDARWKGLLVCGGEKLQGSEEVVKLTVARVELAVVGCELGLE